MKTVGVVALSINKDIYESMFKSTFHYLNENCCESSEYEIKGLVFAQGFDAEGTEDITVIRDDSHLMRLGYSISEIREYFTERVLKEYNFDYIVFTDDDFKFREMSGLVIRKVAKRFDECPWIGLVNFKMTKFSSHDLVDLYTINPTFVYMRAGIMIRPEAYRGWGGEYKCIYYEEAVLATKIYNAGYDVMTNATDAIHRTNQSGLGRRLEAQYADSFNTMPGGRQIICNEYKLAKPSMDEDTPNYRRPCKLRKSCVENHDKYHRVFVNSYKRSRSNESQFT